MCVVETCKGPAIFAVLGREDRKPAVGGTCGPPPIWRRKRLAPETEDGTWLVYGVSGVDGVDRPGAAMAEDEMLLPPHLPHREFSE